MHRWLTHPRLPLFAAAIAFVLVLPSLAAGHMVDDLMHAHVLRGGDVPGGPRGTWDLYRFSDGGPGLRRGIDEGLFPWWSSPGLKFAFLRPLSSVLVAADHGLLGDAAWVSHLLSCLAYAGLVYLVASLFRRVLPGAAAGLAALLFAVDDAHHLPVLWIANRHAILSAAFGVAALLCHLRSREGRGPAWGGPVLLAASLAAGESALTVLPYAVAWAWWLDPAGRHAALRALAPWGVVTAVWAAAYVLGGYGARESALYLDPSSDPGTFVVALATRLPQLVLAQVFLPPADLAPLVPPEHALALAAACLVAVGAFGAVLLRLTRGHPTRRFFAVGGVLSLLPCCATFPSDRLLVLSGVGAFGLIALVIVDAARSWRTRERRRGLVAFGLLLAAVHLPLATVLMPLRMEMTRQVFTGGIARGAATIPHDPAIRGKTLVILVSPDALMTTYMVLQHLVEGNPVPKRTRLLAVSQRGTVSISRDGDRSLVLRSTEPLNVDVFSRLYRARDYARGERIRAGDLEVEVLEINSGDASEINPGDASDPVRHPREPPQPGAKINPGEGADGGRAGHPVALRFTFDTPISAESQRWIAWQGRGYVEVPVLPPGGHLEVPTTDWMTAMSP